MGREIEIKIPLSFEEYTRLFDIFFNKKETVQGVEFIKKNSGDEASGIATKRDEYWSKYNSRAERIEHKEAQVIRIRSEETSGVCKAYFTIKHKIFQNGIELNKEDETFVEDPEVLREFFIEAGYHKWFEKIKKSCGAYCYSSVLPGVEFHVEVELVNDLPYIEIEVTQEQGEADKIKQALQELVRQLGLNPEKRDIRSWVEILEKK